MESQPQNPEFRNNPENFHPCADPGYILFRKQDRSRSAGFRIHTVSHSAHKYTLITKYAHSRLVGSNMICEVKHCHERC